jgi:hypothetical protein
LDHNDFDIIRTLPICFICSIFWNEIGDPIRCSIRKLVENKKNTDTRGLVMNKQVKWDIQNVIKTSKIFDSGCKYTNRLIAKLTDKAARIGFSASEVDKLREVYGRRDHVGSAKGDWSRHQVFLRQ